MKYIKVRIAGKGREYTYSCDDDNVQPGDLVTFTLPSGVDHTTDVIEVSVNQPSFMCKSAMKVT